MIVADDMKKKRKRRRIWVSVLIVILLLTAVLSLCDFRYGFGLFRRKNSTGELTEATVIAVYDGDTVLVRMPDGSEETVRLLMIDAPESVHPDESKNTEEGRQASEFLKKLLPKDSKVYLEFEEGDIKKDSYNRLLAFMWLTDTTSVESSFVRKNMVNAILIEKGFAEFHLYDNGNRIREDYRRILQNIH